MPSARIGRGIVSLAASAITAVYAASYVHTQSADSASAGPDVMTPVAAQVADATPAAASVVPAATATPEVITDQAVEVYADQHHVSWDVARAQMEDAGGVEPVASRPTATEVVRATATLAAGSAPAARTNPPPTAASQSGPTLKDGTYTGAGTSRRGGIQVSLTVQGGRIANVNITGASTEYPTRDIAGLPREVVSRQSAQVDMVSGATYSSLAFRGAVQQALQRAQG